jgi:hypothetical protein
MIKSNTCSKGGIKIHETSSHSVKNIQNIQNVEDPQEFYNKIKNQNKHTGVRIEESKNEYNIDPFDGSNPFNNPEGDKQILSVLYDKSDYNKLDLNIDNYSQKDLYKLFGIETQTLSEDIMRISKRIVLKTHPDKSGLEPKYFLFFSKAYKVLHGIYQFQNKNLQKIEDHNEYNTIDKNILNNLFEKNKMLKNPENFNKWFNEEFDKNKLEDNDTGYAEWLKSNEDIIDMGNVSQANMGIEIEKRKKQVQALLKYEGIDTQYASTFGSTLMNKNENYTSNSLFNDGMNYTDLKQAYVESVIPITEDDYAKLPKFQNVEEYKRHRESVNIVPLDKETSIKQLFKENKQQDEESVALAYYYATQNEKVKQKSQSFWANLKQLMN